MSDRHEGCERFGGSCDCGTRACALRYPSAPILSAREQRLREALIVIRDGYRGLDAVQYATLAHGTAARALEALTGE